jgi:Na+-transporting NADH:ubiquinone oxidoreductase subunit A
MGLGVMIAIGAIVLMADTLLKVEASKLGIDVKKKDIGIFPSILAFFSSKSPEFVGDNTYHSLSKGFNLKLAGEAASELKILPTNRVAVKPTDFRGLSPIPKVLVEPGDTVKAGDVLFFDKKVPEVMYSSPVSGEILDVERGDKRSIAKIIILADKVQEYKKFSVPSLELDRKVLVDFLAESGAWSLLNQRPFDIVPALDLVPRDIYISTFDTAPLAPDSTIVIKGNEAYFQKGIDVLAKLTTGKVNLGLNAKSLDTVPLCFREAQNVALHWFKGKHPVGNVGIQIHNTKPIKGDDKVFSVTLQNVIALGKLFTDGILDGSRIIAIAGSRIAHPTHVKTYAGASVEDLVKNNTVPSEKAIRFISGDVLSGTQVQSDDFLSLKDDQLTAISEGDDYELFGWLVPLKPRPTISGTFPNFLYPDFKFDGDTNTHGEQRAFVVSGQYEEVLPMNIYPQHLMKAIMANDFEKMEGLGINELSEEDIAVCEFVCTSKIPLQSILREGLDQVRSQG